MTTLAFSSFISTVSIHLSASTNSLVGLPQRGRFDTEPVSRSFLIIRVTLAKLTSKPSPFNNLNISGGDLACKEPRFVFACNCKLLA